MLKFPSFQTVCVQFILDFLEVIVFRMAQFLFLWNLVFCCHSRPLFVRIQPFLVLLEPMESVCNMIFSCNLTLTIACLSTAYFFHGFIGTTAAVSFLMKKSYTAPPVSGDTIFLFSVSQPAMAPRRELSTFRYSYSFATALRFPFKPVCWMAPVTP